MTAVATPEPKPRRSDVRIELTIADAAARRAFRTALAQPVRTLVDGHWHRLVTATATGERTVLVLRREAP